MPHLLRLVDFRKLAGNLLNQERSQIAERSTEKLAWELMRVYDQGRLYEVERALADAQARQNDATWKREVNE